MSSKCSRSARKVRQTLIKCQPTHLRIGVHWDVEATDGVTGMGHTVSQAFCSALPVAYTNVPSGPWRGFASLILEAAYEATMWAAVTLVHG